MKVPEDYTRHIRRPDTFPRNISECDREACLVQQELIIHCPSRLWLKLLLSPVSLYVFLCDDDHLKMLKVRKCCFINDSCV